MIHCPYCGSGMEDNAQSCPRCKSLMVVSETPHPTTSLPRWLHPLSVAVVLIIASFALLAIDLKPWGKGKTATLLTGEPSALPAESVTPAAENGAAASDRQPAAPDPAADLYKQVNDYVANVNDTLAQADGVSAEIERLSQQNDKSQLGTMREKQSQLQHFTTRLRSIAPPADLAGAHTRLCNSQAVLARAYRSLSMYVQSGDTKQLDRATRDLKTAKETKDQALAEITAYRDKIPVPAAPPPAAEPQPENPPPASPPPASPPPGPAPPPPATEPETPQPAESGAPVDGSSPSPGNTAAAPADGQQPETPLVPDGNTAQPAPRRRRH